MVSIFENLETVRQYSVSIGLTKEKFEELLEVFTSLYQPKLPNRTVNWLALLTSKQVLR